MLHYTFVVYFVFYTCDIFHALLHTCIFYILLCIRSIFPIVIFVSLHFVFYIFRTSYIFLQTIGRNRAFHSESRSPRKRGNGGSRSECLALEEARNIVAARRKRDKFRASLYNRRATTQSKLDV